MRRIQKYTPSAREQCVVGAGEKSKELKVTSARSVDATRSAMERGTEVASEKSMVSVGKKNDVVCLVDARAGDEFLGGEVLANLMVEAKGKNGCLEVKTLLDTGSERKSFITPAQVRRIGLGHVVRVCDSRHTVAGSGVVGVTQCLDVMLRFGGKRGKSVVVTLLVMDMPVDMLLGMDLLRRLGAVVDIARGFIRFERLGLTCQLERFGGEKTRGGLDAVAAVAAAGDEGFAAEVRRLDTLPDLSIHEACEACDEILLQKGHLFGDPIGSSVPPVDVKLKEEYIRAAPINIPQRRVSRLDADRIERHIEKERKMGFITESRSGWNFPVVLADKPGDPDGRMCVNFAPLSRRLKDDFHWSIPRIRDLLDRVAGCKVFSKIDLRSGFKQFKLTRDSQDMLSFTGPDGRKWKFLVMPFGIKLASEVFQAGMTQVIGQELLWLFVQLYIDDCLAATKTRRSHLYVLKKLLDRFDQYDLRLAREKCKFLRSSVDWLGHMLDEYGVYPNPEKLRCIEKIPVPACKEDVRQFMHMAQWHLKDYAPHFSKHAAKLWPLTSTKREVRWQWGMVEQRAFESLKGLCSTKLMRTHF